MPFHTASIGKLATATLVLQMNRGGILGLDEPIESILPAAEIDGLFAATGATVEQLLDHTSGVADYFDGPVSDGPTFLKLVLDEPDRHFDPDDLLAFSRERQRPLAEPGRRFAYSDTGYVLLGRILEERTGQSFTELLRQRIFEPAGMEHSVFWMREPGPARIAPFWLNRTEASHFASVSCDWAGGGIVSTVDDLARFAVALGDGTLVHSDDAALMGAVRNRFRPGIHYGLGGMELRFEGFMPLLRGLPRPVGHIGVLGTHCFRYPEHDAVVVLNFHGTQEMVASFQTHIRIAQGLARLAS